MWQALTWTFTFLVGILLSSVNLAISSLLGGTSSILRSFLGGTSEKTHPVYYFPGEEFSLISAQAYISHVVRVDCSMDGWMVRSQMLVAALTLPLPAGRVLGMAHNAGQGSQSTAG